METAIYKIGQVYIEISLAKDMIIPDNMCKFRVHQPEKAEPVRMKYFLEFTEDIIGKAMGFLNDKIPGKEARRPALTAFQTTQGECRIISIPNVPEPYAVSLFNSSGITRVWVDLKYRDLMGSDTIFVSLLALEKVMIDVDAMILHSAYMCYNDRAVLFSAPSETGKSTQAGLWEKYRGTRVINGDRSLLIRENDGWKAYGWPVCGSSAICNNESYPIHVIVMLKQAKENKVYPLTGFQAVREVMEQITINSWDRDFQIRVMDNLDSLLQEVPVYRLECDISEEAVICLEKVLG